MAVCTQLDQIKLTEPAGPVEGCEECLATGGWWVHLRMCQTCGRIGCCDSSPNRHASATPATTTTPWLARWSPARTGAGAISTRSASSWTPVTEHQEVSPA
jgi:hypothetical protein